ncbi:hypothetical protein ONJ87_25245, partial [Salmonella enterica subsp. enterica serovar Anatum]|nr:hypothetical protein [Salmonella enterica subsp. enterica serovar Anatum]
LRPEELQKVVGERGRRGTLMRGLQRIDRIEIDSPHRVSPGDRDRKSTQHGEGYFLASEVY